MSAQQSTINYEKVVKETKKALNLKIVNKKTKTISFIWVPKSQILHQDEFHPGYGFIVIPSWLAKQYQ